VFVPVFGDPSRIEANFNKMLMNIQEKERQYLCPIDGCRKTFSKADLAVHMSVCDLLKVIGTAGCNKEIPLKESHGDCGRFWYYRAVDEQELVKDLRKDKAQLMERLEGTTLVVDQLREDKRALEQQVEELSNKAQNGGEGEQRQRKRPARHEDFVLH
jgi:hypothetical protein